MSLLTSMNAEQGLDRTDSVVICVCVAFGDEIPSVRFESFSSETFALMTAEGFDCGGFRVRFAFTFIADFNCKGALKLLVS